jgi:DNA-binding CsgD family transcriptional regulator
MSQNMKKLESRDLPREEVSPRRQSTGEGALTARETEVLGWLAEGKRDREIAIILGISVFTVGKHVQNILKKLRVENRTAASRFYVPARKQKQGAERSATVQTDQ